MKDKVTMHVPSAVRQRIEDALTERLAPAGLRSVEVTAGEDFEGDAILYVDAYFDLTDSPLDPTPFHFLTTELRRVIMAAGESRFPLLRYHFHEGQKVAGWR